jgi:putative oxidoreductase
MLYEKLAPLQSFGLLLLRVIPGALLLAGHGWGKLTSFSENAASFPDPLGVGSTASLALTVFAEVICSALVVVGAATRLAAVPIVIMLIVAATIIHAEDPWQKKEFALLYAIPFLTLIFTGPGRISVDHWFATRRRQA